MSRPEGHAPRLALAIAVLTLSACATSASRLAPERPDRPWVPSLDSTGEIVPGKSSRPAPGGGFVLPAVPLPSEEPRAPAVDSQRAYSLPELINLAASNNPTTRVAWNDARRSALAAGIAESTFLPRITVGAIAGYQAGNSYQSFGVQPLTPIGFNNNGTLSGTVSAVSLQWLLFDFGERGALVDAAEQASLVSNILFTAAHQKLIYTVSLAFYRHAAAQARLATALQSLKNSQTIQAAADDRYKQGIGTVVEVAQARQVTAQAQLGKVQAEGGAQDAYLTLITAIGLPHATRLKIGDVSGRPLSPSMIGPVETIIREAMARRPDIQSAYAAQKISLANMRAAQASFLPKLFVSATGTYNSGNLNITAMPTVGQELPTLNVNGNQFGGSLLAGVTFPLYDGGTRSAALAQARIDVDSSRARLTQVRDEAIRQIVLADNALHTSLAGYGAARSLVEAAQTTFDAALAAYRGGTGSVMELAFSEAQLAQAKYAVAEAYSTALAAAATLALATGLLGAAPA